MPATATRTAQGTTITPALWAGVKNNMFSLQGVSTKFQYVFHDFSITKALNQGPFTCFMA